MTSMPQATPVHQAALTLHGLSDADRQWVLQGLSAGQQDTLRPLLQELVDIGIPREAELARLFVPTEEGPPLQALDRKGVAALAQILCGEPPRVAAALLASRAAPWREQLLRELPPAFARQVERLATACASAGVLQEAVTTELLESLRDDPPTPAPHALWGTLRRRLAAWKERR